MLNKHILNNQNSIPCAKPSNGKESYCLPARGGAHLLARHTLPLQEMVPLGRVLPISQKLGPLSHMVHTKVHAPVIHQ
jgi:hypothetical protein